MTDPSPPPGLMRKFVSRTLLMLVLIGALLFGSAGTFAWPQAWIYLALMALISFAGGLWLARRDPGLLAERLGSVIQRGQKGWDKAFMLLVMAVWFSWLVLMGFDAVRFHWSEVPLWVQALGLLSIGVGCFVVFLVFRANSYASPVVRIQRERGHAVVTTGPYAYVRHPMYAGGLFIFFGAPLLLGSWWGLAVSAALSVLVGFRAVLEERTLVNELEGYAAYAGRVRYRLVPYLW